MNDEVCAGTLFSTCVQCYLISATSVEDNLTWVDAHKLYNRCTK